MTLPRSQLIDPECTPYYHCVSRCVRRAFLCGSDPVTGRNFDHRRAWIERRIFKQAEIFSIDVCAYAVMSNHYHLVLHIDPGRSQAWTDTEVVVRWSRLFRIPTWFESADSVARAKTIALWRERLSSISWFKKCLNEPIARMANEERLDARVDSGRVDLRHKRFWMTRRYSNAWRTSI
ncbi:MAG: transposase [Woeseiaceae bacterium]|nr:transposase [Woeseiaceae bacterium]